MINIVSKNQYLCDNSYHIINLDGDISQIEFLPGSNGSFIATYRSTSDHDNDNKWQIVKISISNSKYMVYPLVSNITKPSRFHVTHNGKNIYFINNQNLINFSINDNTQKIIQLRIHDINYKIDYTNIDWDISYDNSYITFDARDVNSDFHAIFIEKLDNNDNAVKILSDNQSIYERYSSHNGKYMIELQSFPYNLAMKLHFIPPILLSDSYFNRDKILHDFTNDNIEIIHGNVTVTPLK